MTDKTHLLALMHRLESEQKRLENAKSTSELKMRGVWVAGIKKEIESEKKFLGLDEVDESIKSMTDGELLNELYA